MEWRAGLEQGPKYAMTVRGAPALIHSVAPGKKYTIEILTRNLNHDPEDPWAGAQLKVGFVGPACLRDSRVACLSSPFTFAYGKQRWPWRLTT